MIRLCWLPIHTKRTSTSQRRFIGHYYSFNGRRSLIDQKLRNRELTIETLELLIFSVESSISFIFNRSDDSQSSIKLFQCIFVVDSTRQFSSARWVSTIRSYGYWSHLIVTYLPLNDNDTPKSPLLRYVYWSIVSTVGKRKWHQCR